MKAEEKIKKIKCPVCRSEEVKINGSVLKCSKCQYMNTNYKIPSSPAKHKVLHKDNIKKLDKEMINYFYIEVLDIWIKTINKNRENFPDVGVSVNKLSVEFQDNLKGFFDMIEKRLEIIKENEDTKKQNI